MRIIATITRIADGPRGSALGESVGSSKDVRSPPLPALVGRVQARRPCAAPGNDVRPAPEPTPPVGVSANSPRAMLQCRPASPKMPPVRSTFRRWLVLALLVLMPAQSVIAAAGVWCAAAKPDVAMGASHEPHDHGKATHHDSNGGAPASDRTTCSACAPCSGCFAVPTVAPSGVASIATGDDFPPVVIVLRPAWSLGLERPPRTI